MILFLLGLFAGVFIAVLMYVVFLATAEDGEIYDYYEVERWGDSK